MKRCGLGIFVKTPSLSPVKTRLWPAIGQEQATRLFGYSADATRSVVLRSTSHCSLHAYWAVAEAAAMRMNCWKGLPTIGQGGGGLGERMSQVYNQLRQDHHGAILIGADSPQLPPSALQAAVEWLDSNERRLVIGPAFDGGFWLFGGNVDIPDEVWTQAEYSRADTASSFGMAMDEYGKWLELPTLRDLDRPDDIAVLADELALVTDATEQQLTLLTLLDQLCVNAAASS